ARQPGENFSRVIELVGYFERFRVVRQTRRIFDKENVVPEPLHADDVMNVLPDNARDRHRSHKAHDNDALAFHQEDNPERPTWNVHRRPKKIRGWALGFGSWALE